MLKIETHQPEKKDEKRQRVNAKPATAEPERPNLLWEQLATRVQSDTQGAHGSVEIASVDDEREQEANTGPPRPEVPASAPPATTNQAAATLFQSTGRPLDAETGTLLKSRLGPKVDEVRIHDDSHAATLADAIDAKGFAFGRHVALGEATSGPGERSTLEHEVVHAVRHASPSTIFRDPKKPKKKDPEAKRIEKLEGDYAAALAKPDWEEAARLLNGFSGTDIEKNLRKLSGTDQAAIRWAAPTAMPGFSDRIVNAIDALNPDAKRVSELIGKYENALKAGDWGPAALALNGFSDDDILVRVKRLNLRELAAIKAAALSVMPGWSDRVVRPIEGRQGKEARSISSRESSALAHLQRLATKAASETGGADFQKAVLEFKKQLQIDLESIPTGAPLPPDLQIVFQALLLWDVDKGDQWGEGSFDSKDFTPSAGDYAMVPASQNKCNAFLAEVIFKAFGVVHHGHLKDKMKTSDPGAWFPYQAKEWGDSSFTIPSFPVVSSPIRGDILCTGGHVGIYLGSYAGKDIYISARDDAAGLFAQGEQFKHGIQIKYTKPGIFRRYTP
jgi:hypothetical protein